MCESILCSPRAGAILSSPKVVVINYGPLENDAQITIKFVGKLPISRYPSIVLVSFLFVFTLFGFEPNFFGWGEGFLSINTEVRVQWAKHFEAVYSDPYLKGHSLEMTPL